MKPVSMFALIAGLALLAPSLSQAQTNYKIQPIIKIGDMAGDVPIPTNYLYSVEAFNDNGQILLVAARDPSWESRMLFQYSEGKLIPIVVSGRDAPGGTWASDAWIPRPLTMNQRGNVAFAAPITIGGETSMGTFLWDAKAQQVKAVALKGMPAPGDRVLLEGGSASPKINNHDEIVFPALVKSSHVSDGGIFFLGRDGTLQAVALPDQELPGGAKLHHAQSPQLNDAGMIAFPAWRFPVGSDGEEPSGYLWENGTLSLIAKVGQDAPGGGKFAMVWPSKLNNKDRSVLVEGRLSGSTRQRLYRFSDGQLTLVLQPRQEMPGGGTLPEITGFSDADDAGRHVFTATLDDKSTGLYLLERDGKLSLLLKSGTKTELGTITQIGQRLTPQGPRGSVGAALNNKGQIALAVKIDSGPDTVVLLTPSTP